ncbi:hypothetical protein [Stieleria varia]|uniref:hypothetical protein n=1 Tax=Stieleria varia TaxID=2528005 RepID=UPI0011B85241|nr:hypothetical protein [Stieleria varia]
MNRHGVLKGYDEQNFKHKSVRAIRIFCSNRGNANGCGKTFSVWIADKAARCPYLPVACPAKGKIERFFRRVRDPFLIDLRGRKIVLRHERHRDGDVIVYEGGRRIGKARLLDAVANGMMRRKETS